MLLKGLDIVRNVSICVILASMFFDFHFISENANNHIRIVGDSVMVISTILMWIVHWSKTKGFCLEKAP